MKKEDHLLRQFEEEGQPKITFRQSRSLKRLQKHDFLTHENGEYKLTERGRIASKMGVKEFLRLERVNHGPTAEKKWIRRSMGISLFFILLLCLYIFYLLLRNPHVIGS